MNNGKNNNSALPLIIIGLVLVVAVVAAYVLYNRSSSSSGTGVANRPATNSAKTPAPVKELGAQPPNQLGSPNASVTVEEFADFQCPTCGVKHPMMKELTSLYGNRIRFIFRNYPLQIAAHDKAYYAAVAAEAAGLQGRFWDMQNLLFTNQKDWTANPDYRKVWEGYASQIGLDVERFKTDMAGTFAKGRVDADLLRGRALNVNSTPSVFVNGMLVPFEQMSPEGMRAIIDGELAKAQTNQQSQTNSGATNSSTTNSSTTSSDPANAVKK